MKIKSELKIIADHLRSSCFLIADGILPSNEGRGYVLRRIMRRAMLQIHKLEAKESLMHKLVDDLILEFKDIYPELKKARENIIENLLNEEEKFRDTLDRGLKILNEELSKIKNQKSNYFSGALAFRLYDTFGFPLDLTQDILKDYNLEVDIEEFNIEMKNQRQKAKDNWVGSGEESLDKIFFAIKRQFGATNFVGYQQFESEATILAILIDNKFVDSTKYIDFEFKNIAIVLDKTPFYGTSGGQKGDDGFLIDNQNNQFLVSETKKINDILLHFIDLDSLKLKNSDNIFLTKGQKISTIINVENRKSRARNHSATHLLHKTLKEVLGNSIVQKGSNVDFESFTFDFNFNRSLSESEIITIEDIVNKKIIANQDAETKLMKLEDAKNSGAEALFGEKYDSEVRVVNIGSSIELCGGTHVKASGDIGLFKIISEKSIASGIRRIEAKTAEFAIEYLRNQQINLENKINNLNRDIKNYDKEIDNLKRQILFSRLDNIESLNINNLKLVVNIFKNTEAKDLREISNELKKKEQFKNNTLFLLFSTFENKVTAIVVFTADLENKYNAINLINAVITYIGGKNGGGKPNFAMGGGDNEKGINQAIEVFKSLI